MTNELPTGWSSGQIDDLAVVNPPGSTVVIDDATLVSFVPMAAVTELAGHIDLSRRRPFGEVKNGFTRFRDGDVLFAKITPSMENGKIAVARDLEGGLGCGTTEFHVIRPESGVEPDYLRYYLVQSVYRQEARRNMQGAVGQQRVPPGFLRSSEIPVAPSGEQKRIVSKVDELFSDLDEGERALEQAQRLVKRYQQSVLKAAVTGELTREWREQNKGKLESGESLLARIFAARREAWEQAELEKLQAKGITPIDDKWKLKYEEPGEIVTDYLGELPLGWQRIRVDVGGNVQLGRQRAPAHHRGEFMRPYLRVANVFEERIDTEDIMSMNFTPEEFVTYAVRSGDVLLNEGQSKELVGRPAIYRDEIDGCCFTNTIVRFRATKAVLPEFALIVFLHYMKSGYFQEIAKITTNIAHLGAGRFAEMAFPVPTLDEQRAIVDTVAQQQSGFAHLSSDMIAHKRQAVRLRQSILKAAFSGQLVPQDPTDAPASALLKRIATERATEYAAPKRGRMKKATE